MLYYLDSNLTLLEFTAKIMTMIDRHEWGMAKIVTLDRDTFDSFELKLSKELLTVKQYNLIERIELVLLDSIEEVKDFIKDQYRSVYCKKNIKPRTVFAFHNITRMIIDKNCEEPNVALFESFPRPLNEILCLLSNLVQFTDICIFFSDDCSEDTSNGAQENTIWTRPIPEKQLSDPGNTYGDTVVVGQILSRWIKLWTEY